LQSIEGLRALAIILVFFNHANAFIPVVNRATLSVKLYVSQGWIGVDLFFVISGFLITGILIDTREAKNYFSGFYARRILRIFPLYYTVLTGVIVLGQVLVYLHVPRGDVFASLTPLPSDRWTFYCFLTNWIGLWKAQWDASFGSILAHFWSLAVEEQFYFFWPLVVWLVRPRWVPWIAGVLATFSFVIRLFFVLHIGVDNFVAPVAVKVQLATICRLDGLFVGAICAYLYRNQELMKRIRPWLKWIGAIGAGSYFVVYSAMLFFPEKAVQIIYGASKIPHDIGEASRLYMVAGGYSLMALGFGAIVLLAAQSDGSGTLMQRFLGSRVLAPVGKYSYGIYVFHVPLLGLINVFLVPRVVIPSATDYVISSFAVLFLFAVVSFIIPALSYEFFEKPILMKKRYFEPKYSASESELENCPS
jgi:peptidoglycan/LPS O-acetylase OafA/YrhL